ncbi:MAG: hypothetical protein ACTSPA_04325 [Promethearchaeota archaeon]
MSGLSSLISVTAKDYVDPMPMDISAKLKKEDLPLMHQYAEKYMEKDGVAIDTTLYPDYPNVGAIKLWAILDDYLGGYFATYYILYAIGEVSEIWVQMDLGYNAKKGDHRETPIVTIEQCEYLLSEFENTIYPIDTDYFGQEEFHNGSNPEAAIDDFYDEDGKSVILVSNIRDEHYYNPDYPYYIAGFYSPTFEGFFDRNIISIDCLNWEDRVGPDVPRPFLYEAIIAHEYQHLIHDDWNTFDDLFMNEGCSMYAEPLCGYPLAWGDIDSYLATPDNSLTDWGDQGGINILADYGSALMWAIYLSDTFGPNFLKYFVQNGTGGIEGLNVAFEEFDTNFDEVFHDWRIANLIHSGDYNYEFMDLGETLPARIYDLTTFPTKGIDFGETVSILDNPTGVYMLGAYSTDYIGLDGFNDYTLSFNGDDFATLPTWENDGKTLYTTPAASEMDLRILCDLNLDENSILSFDTMFEIELDWDFGFVQISDDDGETWTSLENEYTTSEFADGGYPAIEENLPGLSGVMSWTNMEFDLSPYSGEVILQFRYMTDWAFEEPGWWIENVMINEDVLDLNEFYSIIPEADFMVTLTNADGTELYDLVLDDLTEEGTFDLGIFEDEYILLIVSATVGMADYELDFY